MGEESLIAPSSPPAPTGTRLERLLAACAAIPSAVVGFSAGVDSTVVLWGLLRTIGRRRVLAVVAWSPTLPQRELADAKRLASEIDAPLLVVESEEMSDPRFRSNPADRCYFCKSELYSRLAAVARERGYAAVTDGTNLDDEGDWRPGLRAGAEHAVRSPLREARLTKADVRWIARAAGLRNADKPALACLSSRIPHGEVITLGKLAQVERAEEALRDLGFGQLRVRHHGDVARIELPAEDLARAVQQAASIVAAVRAAGYRHVALDLAGYRSGSLNPDPAAVGVHAPSPRP